MAAKCLRAFSTVGFWLKVLNDHILGPGRNDLCGDAITVADAFGAAFLTLGEAVGCDFAGYPYV
jgi:glutathione S-transferase